MTQTVTRLLTILALSIICQFKAHAQWSQTPGPFGGAVFFLESYAGAYWAGSESGLYRSVDGQQWSRVENLGIEPIVAGLADQDTLYLVRGLLRCDLLTSTDGGPAYTREQIGKIAVTEYCTFVGVERSIAKDACAKLNAGKVKGKSVRARLL